MNFLSKLFTIINSFSWCFKQGLCILVSCFINSILLGQGILGVKAGNYVGAGIGLQMTGIRKEDFVSNNMSPRLNLYLGKRLNDIAAIQVGFEGVYFNTIADDDRRYFNYYNVMIENKIFQSLVKGRRNKLNYMALQLGGGLLYNKYYGRPNFCGDLGLVCAHKILNKTSMSLRLNSILGWDLYQGDADIINGFTIGIKYEILMKKSRTL